MNITSFFSYNSFKIGPNNDFPNIDAAILYINSQNDSNLQIWLTLSYNSQSNSIINQAFSMNFTCIIR